MRYKGAAFDFDYTLGDSTEGIVLCANYGLEKLGCSKAQYNDIKKTIGFSLSDTYQMLTGDSNEEKKERFAQHFKEKADQVMTANASLYEGVSELLKEMKASGLKLAVVTTKYHCRIEEIIKKYNLSDVLDAIIGSDDVVNPKPAPEGIRMLLDSWDMKEEELLYVGDSLVDAKTASAAKVSFAAVTSGTTTQEMFQQSGYDCIGIYSGVEKLRNVFIQEKETALQPVC